MYCKSCGAKQEETQSQTAYQTGAQTRQNPNMDYQPAPKKNSALGKIVGETLLLGVILFVMTGTSYSQPRQQKATYAKIDCELTGKADEFEWNLLGLNVALQMNVLEQHELTQADKNAIQYVINYIEKNMQPLENKGIYQVVLYKDYYSEHDKSGWAMWLRYNRTIEDFDAVIARF